MSQTQSPREVMLRYVEKVSGSHVNSLNSSVVFFMAFLRFPADDGKACEWERDGKSRSPVDVRSVFMCYRPIFEPNGNSDQC
jgi:hypothetical protein